MSGQEPQWSYCCPQRNASDKRFCEIMHERNIPFILLDSYIPDLNPLSFFGQDSFCSGVFAAKMLMLLANGDKEIMLMKQMKTVRLQAASRKIENRDSDTIWVNISQSKITELDIPAEDCKDSYDKKLETFFSTHPEIRNCITLGSKAYIVGEFLLRTNRRNVQIMGYDMVEKMRNALGLVPCLSYCATCIHAGL